jgi:signal transduction histidine kinase
LKPKLLAIYVLMVIVPLALLAWMGIVNLRHEQRSVQRRFDEVIQARLRDVDGTLSRFVQERERELLRLLEQAPLGDTSAIREWGAREPLIRQVFVLDPAGERLHPPRNLPASVSEQQFLQRTASVWKRTDAFQPSVELTAAPPRDHGWHTWYWDDGVHFIFWRRNDRGYIVGAECDRVRLLADIAGQLPETNPRTTTLPDGCMALLDANGDVVYQWGAYKPAANEPPRLTVALTAPLNAWRLAYFTRVGPASTGWSRGTGFMALTGLVAVGFALVMLAIYFYKENTRALRDAAQRVSFVNQVSHELKTPLTNIRLYAEMLQESSAGQDEQTSRHVAIIVSESQRLSRLIGNVLTFARHQRHTLALHKVASVPDNAIRSVLDNFMPTLEVKRIKTLFEAGAAVPAMFDVDALEQILGNLFSNVEKYAADGGIMRVVSQQDGQRIAIIVADNGPGIPATHKDRIFQPFQRVSNRVNDGVAGTGIGLTIARELARLHGGDLVLEPSAIGARFRVTLCAPLVTEVDP